MKLFFKPCFLLSFFIVSLQVQANTPETQKDVNELITTHETQKDVNELITTHETQKDVNELITTHETQKDVNELLDHETHLNERVPSCDKNCDKTIESITKRAKGGDLSAQYKLALMLLGFDESTIKQHTGDGIQWLLQATEQGYKPAQDQLYRIYTSQEIQQNLDKPFYWLRRAAFKDQVSALHTLGLIYLYKHNTKKAIQWFRQAAKLNYTPALTELGLIFLKGSEEIERPPNTNKTTKWLQQTVDLDYTPAQIELGLLLLQGNEGEEGRRVQQDTKKTVKWLLQAETQNNVIAPLNKLGLKNLSAVEVQQHLKSKGFEPLFKTAKQGLANSQYLLSWVYFYEERKITGKILTLEWLQKSAEQNYPPAQYMLGLMYINGYGKNLKKDINKAVEWIQKATNQDYKQAQKILLAAQVNKTTLNQQNTCRSLFKKN